MRRGWFSESCSRSCEVPAMPFGATGEEAPRSAVYPRDADLELQALYWRMMSSALALGRRFGAGLTFALAGVVVSTGCSASGSGGGLEGSGATGSGGTGSGAMGGTIDVGTGASNSGGGNPMCVRIGMFGRPPSYGAMQGGADNTDALESWLNAHVKAGTTVDVVVVDTELTSALLGQYDVIVLQALEEREGGPYWSFSAAEAAAFEAWVRAGGGVVALTGYGAQAREVEPTNQLLAFTGTSFNTDDAFATCPDNCCYCAGSSVPVLGWHADHPIAANVTTVGAFHGRTVNPGDGALVASEGTAVYGATKTVGAGRVFLFFDEWVTYSSQWTQASGTGGFTPDASCSDPNNVCNGRTPTIGYQVPQFWYNALKWASGDDACFDFTPDVSVVR